MNSTCLTSFRYMAIIYPLHYTTFVTRPRCILVILLIWLLSEVTALVQLAWLDPFHHNLDEEPTDYVMTAELIYDIVFLVLFFGLPFIFMSFTYICIFTEIIRQGQNIQKQCVPCLNNKRKQRRHERKAVLIFAAMLCVYIICWLPYFALRRVDYSEIPLPLVYVIYWFRFLASLLNPCMYILGKQDFRKSLFHCKDNPLVNSHTSTAKPTVPRRSRATSQGENYLIAMQPLSGVLI